MSYLVIARAVEARLKAERKQAEDPTRSGFQCGAPPAVMNHITIDATLSDAYRHYWTLPENEPMEVFQAAYAAITTLERQIDPSVAWSTLREAAKGFYANHQRCPFCKQDGTLHLPAEQPELELRHGRQ